MRNQLESNSLWIDLKRFTDMIWTDLFFALHFTIMPVSWFLLNFAHCQRSSAKHSHKSSRSYILILLSNVYVAVARGSVSCNKWEYQCAGSVVGSGSDLSLDPCWLLADKTSSLVLWGKETCMTLWAHFLCGTPWSVKCTVFHNVWCTLFSYVYIIFLVACAQCNKCLRSW